jgi:hypothetical protein
MPQISTFSITDHHNKAMNLTFKAIMKYVLIIFIVVTFSSCSNSDSRPDLSNIHVNLQIHRFEDDFFALDSNNTRTGLLELTQKYPDFLPLFVTHVLGLGPVNDRNELAYTGSRRFLHLNRPVYDQAHSLFKKFNTLEQELQSGFRYLSYYYPHYKIPEIYTTVGPMDALAPMSNQEPSPNFMGENFIAIGLQFYLGKDFSIYNDPAFISNIAPQYRSKRFSKEYITTDVFRLVLDDMYPDSSNRLPLIERFIEKGKRQYLLKKLLPEKPDTLLIGYTAEQLKWCHNNERSIYNFFVQQRLLFEIDPALTQNFTTEGPFTQGMPETSPGNIGAFLGWQIVNSFMEKRKLSPDALMKTKAGDIFSGSGYKPR